MKNRTFFNFITDLQGCQNPAGRDNPRPWSLKYLITALLGLSLSVHAGEGMLTLTTVPQEANIYVNCQLKANTTPVILPLPVGTHRIEARKDAQHVTLDVLITDGAVVSKKIVLLDSPPSLLFKGKEVSISEILNPKLDSFETEQEFQKRRQQLLDNRQDLLDVFNQAVAQHKPGYQAGVAYLDKEGYDIYSEIFPVRIEWKDWAKPLDLPENSYIFAPLEDAKVLWQYGQQKPVFVSLEVKDDQIKVSQSVLIGMAKTWAVINDFHDQLQDGSLGPEMVIIPAGHFTMGDIQGAGYNNEQPVQEVSVGSFAISRYEITFAEYDRFVKATGHPKPDDRGWRRGNRPVINVSWEEATLYAEWLSQQTNQDYRLPTEAEWEYAARAGTSTQYSWGNEIGYNLGVCDGCGSVWDNTKTAPVGSFAPNAFGLYDTVGNVWEWTCSAYQTQYQGAEQRCATDVNSRRVIRGGSWYNWPRQVRVAVRNWRLPNFRYNGVGFRLIRK
jgi:formylglycine-generating enzyme required for sulfatase activity